MKLGKLSLIAAVALGCAAGANAADTLTEALTNGKLSTTLRAVYADKTNQENAYQNEHIRHGRRSRLRNRSALRI